MLVIKYHKSDLKNYKNSSDYFFVPDKNVVLKHPDESDGNKPLFLCGDDVLEEAKKVADGSIVDTKFYMYTERREMNFSEEIVDTLIKNLTEKKEAYIRIHEIDEESMKMFYDAIKSC